MSAPMKPVWTLLCGLAVAAGCSSQSERGSVFALHAHGEYATIVEERNGQSTILVTIHESGRLAWRRPLPKGAVADYVHVHGDVVVVSYARRIAEASFEHSVAAFATSRGAPLWTRVLATTATQHGSPDFLTSDSARIIAYHPNDSGQASASALRMSDGQILWTKPVREDRLVAPAMGAGFVAYEGLAAPKLWVLDLATGSTDTFDTLGTGCIVQGEYIHLRGLANTVISALGGPNKERVVAPFRPFPDRLVYNLASCASYKDRIAFVVDSPEPARAPLHSTHVVITDRNGGAPRALALGSDMHWGLRGDPPRETQSLPLHGEVTRFVPYISVTQETGPPSARLLVIDLEIGTVKKGIPYDLLTQYRLFGKGQFWFLSRRGDIVVFDGNSGDLRAAVRISAPATVAKLEPSHIAADKLWLYERGGNGANTIVLSAPSLKPVSAGRAVIKDVTDEYRAALGVP
jgi:hypothetical protein